MKVFCMKLLKTNLPKPGAKIKSRNYISVYIFPFKREYQGYLTSFTFTALAPLGPISISKVTLLFSLMASESEFI